ncbi:MAG: hypothetical protein IPM48_05775 [Saprospiraceae bacterium]|nr:hypothetical protein [Saprospiraceae bacterium]
MNDISIFRLYLLRAVYLFVAVGLGFTIWPTIIGHTSILPLWRGVGCSMLAAVSILALIGIRYPLAMLPILFFELIWKSVWLIAIALPLWTSGQMDQINLNTTYDCLTGVIFLFVIPWKYVWFQYVIKNGDPWR